MDVWFPRLCAQYGAHESDDFAQWPAETENLALLADILNLGLMQVQGTEVPVGNFFIDTLARDVDRGIVIIENQFGLTDHTHLGQILTYLAGQEGRATVMWIAELFREEHRATIDWLNSNTIPGFDFFAVEVEALKIGDSLPAPWFNIVSKPNDWSRDVVRVTRSTDNGTSDERARRIEAQRASQYQWLLDQMERFARVFTDRIRALPLADLPEADFAPDSPAPNPRY